jgi:hypothetical protein
LGGRRAERVDGGGDRSGGLCPVGDVEGHSARTIGVALELFGAPLGLAK